MVKLLHKSRRLAIEGLESRWALAGDSFGADIDAGEAAAVAIAQVEAATSRGETARLASGRDTSQRAATLYRPTPLLRATAVRRGQEPRPTERVAPAQAAEGVATPANGDFNGDLAVDRGDVAVLATHLGLEPAATFVDGELSGDGKVGLVDLARMVFSSPALDVALTTNVTIVDSAGDPVTFTYTVRNIGNSPLSGVVVTDNRGLTPLRQADTVGDGDDLLEFGETWRYAATYVVTQADVDGAINIVNTATADSDQTSPATDDTLVVVSLLAGELAGDVVVRPVNHASFVMSWQGKIIYVDPVDATTGPSRFTGFPKADLILVTHAHGDHFSSPTINTWRDTDVRIVAPHLVRNAMNLTLQGLTTPLANGANVDVHGINVAAVPAYNLDTTHHQPGDGNGYVVTLGEQRIYISGDTDGVPAVRALDDIDVAFVCMNLPFTMTVDEAASVVRDIAPRIVYPYHYSNSDLNRFQSQVGTDLGIEVRRRTWY